MKAAPRTILTSLVLLAVGGLGAYLLLATAPETAPTDSESAPKLVQTIDLVPQNEEIVVTGFGNVIPSRTLTLQPEVSGRIVVQHEALVPGGVIAEGEELVVIDQTDYENALAARVAERKEAEYELAVEAGRQTVAAREWKELKNELSPEQTNESLVLRQPHLERAKALVAKADAAVAQAETDLQRTTLSAPFRSIVLEETVEVGQLVKEGETIATLAGTDTFWVRVTLPLSELRRVQLPAGDAPGAAVKIVLEGGEGTTAVWEGKVTRLLGDLESTGRLVRLLVQVSDPLRLEKGNEGLPLLLGSFVRAEIEAGRLEEVLEVPRAALREDDRVWLVGPDDTLRIRSAEVLWRRKDSVLLKNLLEPGERLVVSDLKSALPGMELAPQQLPAASNKNEGAPVTNPSPPSASQ